MNKKKYSNNAKARVAVTTCLCTTALACVLPIDSILIRAIVSAILVIVVMSAAIIWHDRRWEEETMLDWSGKTGKMVIMEWNQKARVLQLYRKNDVAEYSPHVRKTLIHVDEFEGNLLRKKYAVMVDNITIYRDEAVIRRKDAKTVTIRQGDLVVRVNRCKLIDEIFAA